MGKCMSANLVQNGFDVKGFDMNPKAVEAVSENVSQKYA